MPQYTVTSTRTFKQVVTYRVNSEDEDTAFDLINAYEFRGYHAPIYGGQINLMSLRSWKAQLSSTMNS